MSDEWQQLFAHALAEANRLGIKVNMSNGPGRCGSGGPWVPLDKAMQMVVTSETRVPAGQKFSGALPQPQAVEGHYRDIAVMAFPTPRDPDNPAHRIRNMRGKALMWTGHHGMNIQSLISPTTKPIAEPQVQVPDRDESGLGFDDFLDVINPLQHLPQFICSAVFYLLFERWKNSFI
jgi:hypothetical protein